MRHFMFVILLGLFLLAAVVGCGQPGSPTPKSDTPVKVVAKPPVKDDEHGHKPGQFGGLIVPIGRDSYHAEAVFEKGGVVRLYTLGQDEARVLEVEAQTLAAFVKREGGTEATEFSLKPEPREGDAAGKTSRFVGTLPKEL